MPTAPSSKRRSKKIRSYLHELAEEEKDDKPVELKEEEKRPDQKFIDLETERNNRRQRDQSMTDSPSFAPVEEEEDTSEPGGV